MYLFLGSYESLLREIFEKHTPDELRERATRLMVMRRDVSPEVLADGFFRALVQSFTLGLEVLPRDRDITYARRRSR